MVRDSKSESGWRGAALVCITYVYFLIFAQFGFLKRLAELDIAAGHLKAVMAVMATGGILASLLMPRLLQWQPPSLFLRTGLTLSAFAAFLSLSRMGFAAAVAVAFLIGAGLGILTVTLVTHLKGWAGTCSPLMAVGLGTGTGYFVCNFPPLFNAAPHTQALAAGILCLCGVALPLGAPRDTEVYVLDSGQPQIPFLHVLAAFTALVWLDSAAFFIIQSNPQLKHGTWQGNTHLWTNGLTHLVAALAAAWLLSRKGTMPVLVGAFAALGGACLLLANPNTALLASALYPAGVSLYSVALVAYPSLLITGMSAHQRALRAGLLYAIAGWVGSAMGIGMAQNLGSVPPLFVLTAGIAILLPQLIGVARKRTREIALVAVVSLAAFSAIWLLSNSNASASPTAAHQDSAVERGRQVYISEGCIHCHSQYVRPNSPDVLMWGPAQSVEQIRLEQPPLIGNRRQGPDLSQVGGRRSVLWLKAHLVSPAEVSGTSIMPSYAFLFRDRRGDDLDEYLVSLKSPDNSEHASLEKAWRPSEAAWTQANSTEGRQLYDRHCSTCHDPDGNTRRRWQSNFTHLPSEFEHGPYRILDIASPVDQRLTAIARLVKFGAPETDMPGHEYLSDRQIASISIWLSQKLQQSDTQSPNHSGERP